MKIFLNYKPSTTDILGDLDELAHSAPDFADSCRMRIHRILVFLVVGMAALITAVAFVLLRDPNVLLGFLAIVMAVLANINNGELTRDTDHAFVQLRDRVRRYWLEGSLRPGLEEVRALGIPVMFETKAVVRHEKWHDDDDPVQHTLDIRKIYDGLKSFAILGAPGSGKTTVIMQLALDLLKDPKLKHQAPFLLNLSSWRPGKNLREWILIEGQKSYRAKQKLIQHWLDDNRLTLLLDGFDEVPEEHRAECITEVNAFCTDHPRLRIVVATRTAEFQLASDDMVNGFKLKGAIELQPLDKIHIEAFLKDDRLRSLRKLYEENAAVQQMAGVPFLLNSMAYTYADTPLTALAPELKTIPERQQHLFDTYIEKRLQPPLPHGYTLPKLKKWLGWLANKIGYYSTIFRVDDVNWQWFDNSPRIQKAIKLTISALMIGTLTLVWAMLGNALANGWGTLWFGLAGFGLGSLVSWVFYKNPDRQLRFSLSNLCDNLINMDRGRWILLIAFVFLLSLMPLITRGFNSLLVWIFTSVIFYILLIFIYYITIIFREFDLLIIVAAILWFLLYPLVWTISQPLERTFWLAVFVVGMTMAGTILLLGGLEESQNRRLSASQLFQHIIPFASIGILFTLVFPVHFWGLAAWLLLAFWLYSLTPKIVYFGFRLSLFIYQPIYIHRYLDFVRSRQILREMGGGHTFRHEALRMSLMKESAGAFAQISVLIRDLVHHSNQNAAIESLATYGELAVKPIIATLHDKNRRESVTNVLVKIGEPAVEPLIATLHDDDRDVRILAAKVLGIIRDVRAVEPLIVTLKDKDSGVRKSAATALVKFKWQAKTIEEEIRFAFVTQNSEKLIQLGKESVATLIVALRDGDRYVRENAISVLVKIGEPAVEPLIAALNDEGSSVRKSAAIALGNIGDVRAVEPLIAMLRGHDRDVRILAAKVLGIIGDVRAVEPLIVTLKDEDSGMRKSAATALGKFKWQAKTTEEEIRFAFVTQNSEKLIQLGKESVATLIVALRDGDRYVRENAISVLVKIGEPAVEPLIAALNDEGSSVRKSAAIALGNIGDVRAVEPLIAMLKEDDQDMRKNTITALGLIADMRAVEPLIAMLKEDNRDVRRNAITALGLIGDVRAVELLIAALKDETSGVRRSAAVALGNIGDVRAVEPLIAAFKDENNSVRRSAATALENIGDMRAVELLIAALKDENSGVRRSAATTLGNTGNARAVDPLIAILKDDDRDVRRSVATALEKIRDIRAVEPFIAMLRDKDWVVQCSAATALGDIGDMRALEPLIIALRNGNMYVRSRAATALGDIGDMRALEPLIVALCDKEKSGLLGRKNVSDCAAEALRKLGTPKALVALHEAGYEV